MKEHHFKHITVGYDFSRGATDAARTALELARLTGAAVRVVIAIPGGPEASMVRELRRNSAVTVSKAEGQAIALEEIEGVAKSEFERLNTEGVDVAFDVGSHNVMGMLLNTADIMKTDLIMMGDTDTRSTFKQVGTETMRVVRHSMWPVWVNKRSSTFPPRRILCPIDLSEASEHAFALARDIARVTGAHLTVIHIADTETLDGQKDAADFENFMDSQDLEGIASEHMVLKGVAYRTIIRTAREGDFDLLAIGSLGRSGIMEVLIGGTTERIVRALPCSMLLVKPDSFTYNFKISF